MKLRNFLVADAITSASDQKLYIHGAGVGSITAPSFPYAHPRLGLLVTFVRTFGESDAERVLVALTKADGVEVARLIDTEIGPRPPAVEGQQIALNFVSDVSGLPFPEPGEYWFVLSADDVELDHILVVVTEAATPTPNS